MTKLLPHIRLCPVVVEHPKGEVTKLAVRRQLKSMLKLDELAKNVNKKQVSKSSMPSWRVMKHRKLTCNSSAFSTFIY
jgi:hypothetical protein